MTSSPSKMKFGIQPTGWTNDDFQEIGDNTPYQVILDQTRQAGFAGGSTGHNYPPHLMSLLHAVSSRGLQICATWAGTTFTRGDFDVTMRAFEAQVAFLKQVGARDVVVAELADAVNQVRTASVLTDRPKLNEPQWYLLTSGLNAAGKYAQSEGMQLSYHPHVGTGVQTLEETVRLLDSTDPACVGLCLDTAHLRYGGCSQSDLVALTQTYKDRISHVHLKNVRSGVLPLATANQFSFYQAIQAGIFTVPGDPAGDLDLRPILQILDGVNYKGWLVVEAEQNPANADPLTYAQTARTFLKTELGY